jgi:hypothetical protein
MAWGHTFAVSRDLSLVHESERNDQEALKPLYYRRLIEWSQRFSGALEESIGV